MMYDLAIIGGGPAGYAAAFEAVCKELHVILFEKDLMGGTCPVSYTHLTLPTTSRV